MSWDKNQKNVYRDLSKEDLTRIVLSNVKINKSILLKSSRLELCEYIDRIKEIKGSVKWYREVQNES